MLRGRKLDKAKVERWKRDQNGPAHSSGQPSIQRDWKAPIADKKLGFPEKDYAPHDDTVDDSPQDDPMEDAYQDDTVEYLPDHGERSMPAGDQSTFNPWLVVDVVGSPRLTRLIGALTIDACEDIPSLDLSAPYSEESEDASDAMDLDDGGCSIICPQPKAQNHHRPPAKANSHSVSPGIAALCASFLKPNQAWMPGPLDELYPFPRSAPSRSIYKHLRIDHLVSSCALKAKELECGKRFQALKSMQPSEVNTLAEDMRSIAWRHMELDQYRSAEIWNRRVVTAFLEIRGHRILEALSACLSVISNIRNQGRYREAINLHRGIYCKIKKFFGPDHDLAMMCKDGLGILRGLTGDYESQVALFRELVQFSLLRFGTRSRDTLIFLEALGHALVGCQQYQEAEALLCIRVQLDSDFSFRNDRDMMDIISSFGAMSALAKSLNQQGKHTDARSVLDHAEECFKDLIRVGRPSCSLHFLEKALTLKAEGRLAESEEIFRALIRHAPNPRDLNIVIAMRELANILERTSREPEAVVMWEKVFSAVVESFGIEHKFSKRYCNQLGFCYARLGRYDDAIVLFKQTAEKVALSNPGLGDSDFRNKYVNDLQTRILKVEQMKRWRRTWGLKNY
jgi:tetratricopeptide (TPR) repeat protein